MASCFEFLASRVEDQFADTEAFFELSVASTDNHIGIESSDVISGQHDAVGPDFFTRFN